MNCEQRFTLDFIPGTAATIGGTFDGITDTLDLTDPIHNVEAKTHLKLNREDGTIDHWNENYVVTEDEGYLEQIPIPEILEFGSLEDLGNVEDKKPKNGDILYYVADPGCGPDCEGVNDSWVHLRAPSDDGTYKLTMTVTNGEAKLSWEAE